MLSPGTQIGGYRIESVLGRGGMGAVYRATQLSLNRVVALKLLDAQLGDNKEFRERFRREGRIQARIDHPHIVTVHEAGETKRGLFIAMRLIDGPNLKELIRAGGLEPERAVRILAQVADALDTAHEAGLMHRDIKPQNILIGRRDHAYLADFGLTKDIGETGMTKSGQFMGTLDYVAPEQIHGKAEAASDVYALAAVAHECLTGAVPFPRGSEPAVMFAHLTDPPPRASLARPGLPAEVDAVLAWGMAKVAGDRPRAATELVEALEGALAGRRLATVPPLPEDPDVPTVVPGTEAPTAPPSAPVTPRADTPATAPVRSGGFARTAAAAAAISLAAGIGLGIATAGGSDPEPESATVSSGDLAVTVPAGWRAAAPPRLQDIALQDAVGLAGPEGEGAAALGTVKELPEAAPDARVRMGRFAAFRYDGSPRLYAAPLAGGTAAVVACVDMTPRSCAEVAATLAGDVEPGVVGPSPEYAARVAAALGELDKERRRLRLGSQPGRQATRAASLARAHRAAREALEIADPPMLEARLHAAILDTLTAVADGYDLVSRAAESRNRSRQRDAAAATEEASRALRAAVRGLRDLGYAVS